MAYRGAKNTGAVQDVRSGLLWMSGNPQSVRGLQQRLCADGSDAR